MKIFNKKDKAQNGKMKDFLRDEAAVDAEIISKKNSDGVSKKGSSFKEMGLLIVAASLVAGLLTGFVYGKIFAPGGQRFAAYDAGSLTRSVQLTKVERVKNLSAVLYDDVDVYDKPSDISGTVIAKLGRNMRVEHLCLVPSLDTKENVGITRFDIKISRLFSKSFIIPSGTEVNLVGFNNVLGEYDATVVVNGKMHNITVNSREIKLPYTKGWAMVRTERGQEGYVYGEAVTANNAKWGDKG